MAKTMSEEKAEYIASVMNADDIPQETFEYKNPVKQVGFAQIEHVIAFDESLSDGAYRTYAVIISFAQRHNWATPSIETLAGLRSKDVATISRHLSELQEHELIDRQRRLGTSSKTIINDIPQRYVDSAKLILQKRDIAKTQRQTLQKRDVSTRKNALKRITIEEEQYNNIASQKNPEQEAKDLAEFESMKSASEDLPKREIKNKAAIGDARVSTKEQQQEEIDSLATVLIGVLHQEDIPLKSVPSSMQRTAKSLARAKLQDIRNGVTTMDEFNEAVTRLRNGAFEKIKASVDKAEANKCGDGLWKIASAIDAYKKGKVAGDFSAWQIG